MVGEQVDAAGGEPVHALQRGRGDEAAPRLRQLELIARQRERHAVDRRARGAQVVHGVLDDRRDAPVDRDPAEVGAVGDAQALRRSAGASPSKSAAPSIAYGSRGSVPDSTVSPSAMSATVRATSPSNMNGAGPNWFGA